MSDARLWLVAGVVAMAAAPVVGQTPTFHAGVELVQLDVTVLDRDRHSVRDLHAGDFTVLEDDRPQAVVAFRSVDADVGPTDGVRAASTTRAAWTRDVGSDVATNELPDGRLFALVLDDALMPADPKILADARAIGSDLISHLTPTDQMAVVFTARGQDAQGLTADRTKLQAAVNRLQSGEAMWYLGYDGPVAGGTPGITRGSSGTGSTLTPNLDRDGQYYEGSLRTVDNVVEAFAGLTDRRKVIVYVTPGVPIDFSQLAPKLASGTGKGTANQDLHIQMAGDFEDLLRHAQRDSVTIDTVDPTGLGAFESYLVGRVNDALTLSTGSRVDTVARAVAHAAAGRALDYLEATAANTGGRAVVNTNNFEPGIGAMVDEAASYYVLAYAATDPGSGRYHRLVVKVDRPGVEVRTRAGYYASDESRTAGAAQPRASAPLTSALASIMPETGLSLRVALASFAGGSRGRGTAPVVTTAMLLSFPAPPAATTETIDVQASAFTVDGRAAGAPVRQTLRMALRAGAPGDAIEYEWLTPLFLPPGRYQVRFAARDETTDRTGSVFGEVDVPDASKDPLSFSGVVIDSTNAPHAAPRDAFAGWMPVVPTTRRVFGRSDEVTAFLRVYEAANHPLAPATLTTGVLSDQDVAVATTNETIGVARFDATTRGADVRYELPLARLVPGEYLLTFDAALGQATVERKVRFAVR